MITILQFLTRYSVVEDLRNEKPPRGGSDTTLKNKLCIKRPFLLQLMYSFLFALVYQRAYQQSTLENEGVLNKPEGLNLFDFKPIILYLFQGMGLLFSIHNP